MADETEQGLVQIIPLEGGYATIELRGGGLPFKGAAFPTEQRIKTTYYVGNPEATQTVGGPTKPNTTFRGRWMDQDLRQGGARTLQLQVEFLVDRAIPVEVRWGGRQLANGEDPAIVRRGLLKKFTPTINRAQDIEWELECEWKGQGIQTKAPTFASSWTRKDNFTALAEQVQASQEETTSWLDYVDTFTSMETNAMLTVSDALDDVGNSFIDAVDVIDGASSMMSDAAGLPGQISDRIQGVCDHIVLVCANARASLDEFCGLWPGLKGTASGSTWQEMGSFFKNQGQRARLALCPTDDPLARLDSQTAQNDLISSWDLLAGQAATASAQLASQRVPDIIATVRPAAGSDLRDLAVVYYGNPDLWIIIADFNNLPSSEVPATPLGVSEDGAPPIYIPRASNYPSDLLDTWGDRAA
jgi:hypothetical protein